MDDKSRNEFHRAYIDNDLKAIEKTRSNLPQSVIKFLMVPTQGIIIVNWSTIANPKSGLFQKSASFFRNNLLSPVRP